MDDWLRPLAEVIGANVRAAREAAGLTQAALAAGIESTVPTVSRLESGAQAHMPSLTTLARVARMLGVSLCSLVEGWPPPKPKRKGGAR